MKKFYSVLIFLTAILFCDSALSMGRVFFVESESTYDFNNTLDNFDFNHEKHQENIRISELNHSKNLRAVIFRTQNSNVLENIKIQNTRPSSQISFRSSSNTSFFARENSFSEYINIFSNSRQSEIFRTISQRK